MARKPAAKPAAKPPTVAQYFADQLGGPLILASGDDGTQEWSPAHVDFHIGTGCGVDCVATIQAAAAFIAQIRATFGDDEPELIESVRAACDRVVCCMVYG